MRRLGKVTPVLAKILRIKRLLNRRTLELASRQIAERRWSALFFYFYGKLSPTSAYARWIRENEPGDDELRRQTTIRFPYEPRISVIVPTYDTPIRFLEECIE